MKRRSYILQTALFTVLASSAAPQKPVNKVPNGRKRIALTFDDGPHEEFTAPILAALKKHQVKATFYQVGRRMKKLPDLSRTVIAEGHEIGNHSMTHPRLPELKTAEAIESEITGFQSLAYKTIGTIPETFRAPYLKFDDRVWNVLNRIELPGINANVYADYKKDAKDLDDPAMASAHADAVVAKVKSGSIILMHERKITLVYLDEIIKKLNEAGYTFCTMTELLATAQ